MIKEKTQSTERDRLAEKANVQPLVSVLMTAYNREKYIAEAIESVLASDYINYELIIVDDCSIDNTRAIAQQYVEKDSRLSLYVNDTNLKQFQNRNKAISIAKGEFIVHVDSDDLILPNGITNLIQTMLQFPESSFGMFYFSDEKKAPFLVEGKEAIHKHFFQSPFLVIGPGATILKRSFLLEIEGYPTAYEAAGDMYFNLKACCYSSIVLIPFKFMDYRVHGEQELNNPYAYIYNNFLYLKDALDELPLGLESAEIHWLKKKNTRRLFVNICRYFLKTFDVKGTANLLRLTGFSYKDLVRAIFQ